MTLKLSDNALKVLERRYLIKDEEGKIIETPEELFRRVARAIASVDKLYNHSAQEIKKTEEEFYNAMTQLEFIPNTPTLVNAGRELGQLSACFVIPVEDSMTSIFEAVKSCALIHRTGGGTGMSFSRLRPKDSLVKTTGGSASGPISFMKVFDAATHAVRQGGVRRGASIGILQIDHPDILEFITCKESDKEITNFNISVAITDDFMQKLAKGQDYDLIDPHTKKVVKRLNTKDVFDLIVKQAHKNGEPGIVFIDRMNLSNPTPALGKIESTNPCLSGDTWVVTSEGPAQINELIGKPSKILVNGEFHSTGPEGFFSTGLKPTMEIRTNRGYRLEATPNHLVLVANKKTRYALHTRWRHVAKLKVGDLLVLAKHHKIQWQGKGSFGQGYLLGLLVGDGFITQDDAVLCVWGKGLGAQNMRKTAESYIERLPRRADFRGFRKIPQREEYRLKLRALFYLASEYKLSHKFKGVSPEIEKTSSEFHRGFLRGIFDTDGSVQGNQKKGVSVRLSQSNLETLQGAQRMLQRLGIISTIYTFRRPKGFTLLPDGRGGQKKYPIKAQHELVISGENIVHFAKMVGFADINKQEALEKRIKDYQRQINRERFLTQVTEIVPGGRERVYDVEVPGVNAFDGNGFFVHNCGEVPLLPYESCNLASINLFKMARKVNAKLEIDWPRLREVVHLGVHFLDNVIDVNKFPLPEIEKNTKLTRKIGLGVMGWASLLVRLGLPYDSQEAVGLANKVMGFILEEAEKKSIELGKRRGLFPAYKGSKWDKERIPLRHATLTTVAPTGTISIIAGPCSSGIEPLFAIVYYRNVMDKDKLIEIDPLFEEVSKKRGFYSQQLMDKIAGNASIQNIEEIPEDVRRVFVTSHDVSSEWHIKMQAAFQQFTHNSVSKTINFPYEASLEDVRKSYLLAYELGCKGITIYRDRSREEQVLNIMHKDTEPQKQKEIVGRPKRPIAPRPRPEVIIGTTTKVATGCGNLYVTINLDEEGRPFELFTQMGKAGGCAASQLEAIGRLVSLAFRSGIEVKVIIEQLRNIRCPSPSWEKGQRIFSCADAIARVIEKRLTDGHLGSIPSEAAKIAMKHSRDDENITTTADFGIEADIVGVCPDCGGTLRHEEGCVKCYACGFSKC